MRTKTRETGWTKSAAFQVGVRKMDASTPRAAWMLVASMEGVAIWSGGGFLQDRAQGVSLRFPDGTRGQVRVDKSGSHQRISWHPPQWIRLSPIQVRVIDRGDRSVIAFHQEHLPDQDTRERRREFFPASVGQDRAAPPRLDIPV